ncbi:hypothetical protein MKW94_022764 [Papaver nudicaule]|uniref:RRP15-like protein n=1 Tax=Papaver nudicaule TaxID=74823 RepID=A0AA41W061_PAPNU|nr:hypothetical protein [Papaver nudicaule]
MSVETDMITSRKVPTRRRPRVNKDDKAKKGGKRKVRVDKKMQKLYRKRARQYNSDDDDDEEEEEFEEPKRNPKVLKVSHGDRKAVVRNEVAGSDGSGEEGESGSDADEEAKGGDSDEEGENIVPGITMFTEGCNAFKMAFRKIIGKQVADPELGPVLQGHKELVAKVLAEEVSDRKAKGEAKKDKHMAREKGHVKELPTFLDSHDKFLIGVATRGVIKLFNAVSKAQGAQKGLNPSSSKDAKVLAKRRKNTFLSELRKKGSQAADTSSKDDNEPQWAPLKDSYMLASSKLKNWDKTEDSSVAHDTGGMDQDSSSDED